MSRSDLDRLYDIAEAIDAIVSHVDRGPLSEGLVFDAVRMRLFEIGEAAKALPTEVTDAEPGIAWRKIARSRDLLAHHYFATEADIVKDTVTNDLTPLREAVARLIADREAGADSATGCPTEAPG